MGNKKPYSDKRWTQPLGGEVIGYVELTEEQRAEYHKKALKVLEEMLPEKD